MARDRWAAATSLSIVAVLGLRVGQPPPAPLRLRVPRRLSRRRGGGLGLAPGGGVHGLGRAAWRSPPSGARPATGSLRALPLHRGDRGPGALPLQRALLRPPVLHVPRLREPRPGRAAARRERAARPGRRAPAPGRLAGLLMMWLDVVIDPLAVRGDRWFLGRIFYYPEPGWYFGVPLANFAGWVVVGAAIAWGWTVLGPRVGRRAARLGGALARRTGARPSASTTSCSPSTWRSRRRWPSRRSSGPASCSTCRWRRL